MELDIDTEVLSKRPVDARHQSTVADVVSVGGGVQDS